jgi:hypothetical protein
MTEEPEGTRSAVAGAQQAEVAVLAGGCFAPDSGRSGP